MIKNNFVWYLKVADLGLDKEVIDQIKEKYSCEDGIDSHFTPKFPSSVWSRVSQQSGVVNRLKSLFRTQETLYLSLKPLLTAASLVPKEEISHILKSIQLITSANIELNRFQHLTIAPHLKPEILKQVLTLPVKHDTFFGDNFAKATEEIVKEQSTLDKILTNPNIKKSFHKNLRFNKPYSRALSSGSQSFQNFRQDLNSSQSFKRRGGGGRG